MEPAANAFVPRCLNRDQAALYLGVSADTVDRLINSGTVPIVRVPVARHRVTGKGIDGVNRRILIDRCDLDALIERSKESRA